jgi:hypothetical protein
VALTASFGGLTWRFEAGDGLADAQLGASYGPHRAPDASAPMVSCRVSSGLALDASRPPSNQLVVERYDEYVIVSRGDFRGVVGLSARRVQFRYCGHVPSLHAFLRVANALLLASLEGVLLHASSIVRRGRAYLFPGPSGAGKTTIARLADGGGVLSDEVSAVRRVGGRFFCYSTPFFGEYDGVAAAAECAPVERICFPTQAARHKLAPTTAAEATQQIVRSVYRHGADTELATQMFDTSAKLAASVPSGWLAFRPDSGFWSVIDG